MIPTVGNRAVLRMCNKQVNLPNQSEQAVVVPHSRSVCHKFYNPNTTLQLASRPEQSKTWFSALHGLHNKLLDPTIIQQTCNLTDF